ncbi:Serine/threonine protein kinase [Sarcoptes scabiei]|nr:Serine/threonine protein kinase [Sarcoptes scabiei]
MRFKILPKISISKLSCWSEKKKILPKTKQTDFYLNLISKPNPKREMKDVKCVVKRNNLISLFLLFYCCFQARKLSRKLYLYTKNLMIMEGGKEKNRKINQKRKSMHLAYICRCVSISPRNTSLSLSFSDLFYRFILISNRQQPVVVGVFFSIQNILIDSEIPRRNLYHFFFFAFVRFDSFEIFNARFISL